ncbi:cytochrome C oxidase subunit IV family protein [Luteolibacter ambystomatis]|uniref:Cytochrome C oxidase subunit IV family protein n=1 Tax=Luteolibacter ambystomatis TaxID=2824561 RepID=A0A975G5T0_9BACT|nr:cytochrome C oxidase subunit IV family protein [Luteolibacter ambystomatis]QUE49857.1 cytochrome C oxidase subunit IV family protein [Luteolibacter ambystomatis]
MADSPEDIKKKTKTYLLVGGVLFIGTVLTYLVATQEFLDFGKHGFDRDDCLIGFAIASVKATLVAAIFMHLNHEKKAVYWIFFGSFITAASLAGLTALAYFSPIHDKFFPGAKPGYEGQAE